MKGAVQPLQTAFMPPSYHPIPTSPQRPLGPLRARDRALADRELGPSSCRCGNRPREEQ